MGHKTGVNTARTLYVCLSKILFTSLVCEGDGGGGVPLTLSNFFDSDNITLKQPLSLLKKFDSDNSTLNSILEQIFKTVLMPNFLALQQCGKINTKVHENRISTVLLYLFYIRKAFLEGASKSSTAFLQCRNIGTRKFTSSSLMG